MYSGCPPEEHSDRGIGKAGQSQFVESSQESELMVSESGALLLYQHAAS